MTFHGFSKRGTKCLVMNLAADTKDDRVVESGAGFFAELCRERVALMGSSGARSGGLSPHPADPES